MNRRVFSTVVGYKIMFHIFLKEGGSCVTVENSRIYLAIHNVSWEECIYVSVWFSKVEVSQCVLDVGRSMPQ